MKRLLIILLLPALLTFGLSKYVPMPLMQMKKANAAFSSFRVMIGAAGVATENGADVTSYAFDGTGDYLSLADHANWDVFGSSADNWTISMWVKFSGTPSGSQVFIAQEEGNNDRWTLYNRSGGTDITLLVRTGAANVIVANGSGSGITDTNWHWVVLAKVASEYGIYLDGTQQEYTNDSSTDTYVASLVIGGGSVEVDFPGNIDDIIIASSNIYSAAPNTPPTNTITNPAVPYTGAAVLKIHCGETILTGSTGSGATFKDSTGVHTVTENGNAVRDTTTYKY